MRGKKITSTRGRQGNGKGLPACLHEIACALQHRERRMAFIQMTHIRLNAQGIEHAPSAYAQHQLLHQTQIRLAYIELAGYAAIGRVICRIVTVQQIQLDPAHLHLPCAQPDRVTGQIKL